jgi:hypothetical protein
MLYPPVAPDLPAEQRITDQLYLRYEDVCQDGRVMITSLPHAVGAVVWRHLLNPHPVTALIRAQGVIPILTRLVMQGDEGTVAVGRPLTAEGGFQLAHVLDDAGEVARLTLGIWVDLAGPRSRTHGPPPAGHGELAPVGRVFAEHVFTRLFAPPDQRKVTRLDFDGLPPVPPDRHPWQPPAATLALPEGAAWLDEGLVPEPTPTVFGLNHTDSNQHVNSLVYPRLFEEAALRRLAALGRETALLPRLAEAAYRKPCFAGDRVRIALRAFEHDGALGAVGCFLPDDDGLSSGIPDSATIARAHCFTRVLFR